RLVEKSRLTHAIGVHVHQSRHDDRRIHGGLPHFSQVDVMRLARLLFKPKWQDKKLAVRSSAVAFRDRPDLVPRLPPPGRGDHDAAVRLAALKRLNDYENWRERSTADPERVVRDNARNTYLALLCAATHEPPLARRIAELDTLSADELERVAASSVDRELRK